MSRDAQHLQRHIEGCLVDRREMADWIGRAQALTPVQVVTERDWLYHGHLSPSEWLFDRGLEEHGCGDDGEWDDWELDDWQPPDDYGDDEPPDELYDDDEDDYDDWIEPCQPPDLVFGGRLYPAEDVEAARVLRGLT